MHWSVYASLFTFFLLPFALSALTGKTCTTRKSRAQSYRAYQQQRKSQRYSTKCGFLGWKRCTRYRNYYVKQSVSRMKTAYFSELICCSGWRVDSSGTNCGIHDKFPIVTSCPSGKTVTATGKLAVVTWAKPAFKEPFNYKLAIKSTYRGEQAQLPWGDTKIQYVATSQNNNKEAKCSFTIKVLPPKPKAVIRGYTSGSKVNVDEHVRLSLECRAEYGRPTPSLSWYRKGSRLSVGTRMRTIPSDFLDYKHAINNLTFNPTRKDDHVTYECRTSPDVTKYSVTLKVKYEVVPVVTYCPSNISRDTTSRKTLITWKQPTFIDPRYNEAVDVVGSLGSTTQQMFSWGSHVITYTGTNRRNKLKVTCSFNIQLQPLDCDEKELVSQNGAVVCAFWNATFSRVCKPYCKRGYDVAWIDRVPRLYVCAVTGRWWPTPAAISCSQKTGRLSSFFLPSREHYFTGNCTESSRDIKHSFIASLKRSPFRILCDHGGCNESLVLSTNCS